ncbi:hypothetical protein [Salinicola halophilus]|uniref:COG4648 family protein n=1 Tax=Salinicola halophilus TaxID=184065 RepID=UPI000DA1685B|nr:hypothetical protein [Salinicola halophilus]
MMSTASPTPRRLLWLLAALLGLAWPLLAHALLPRYGAWPLLIAVTALAWWRLPTGKRRWGWGLVALLGLLWLTGGAELGLRLWPVLINLALLALFAHGRRYPPSPIERLARRQEPALPPHAVRYVRGVTTVWCVFFALNAAMALVTALYADLALWSLYNGMIVYALMALLFAGEWCVRQRVKRRNDPTRMA